MELPKEAQTSNESWRDDKNLSAMFEASEPRQTLHQVVLQMKAAGDFYLEDSMDAKGTDMEYLRTLARADY